MIDITSNTAPFQYNPAITNANIDNQLAGILSQFSNDYILDVVDDSLNNRFRLYDLPMPNIIASYETNFKQLTAGYSSNVEEIASTRQRVYLSIIQKVCDFYNLTFNPSDDTTDIYSIAYWLYDFLVANFTNNMINFYVSYLIADRDALDNNMGLSQMRRENDTVYSYSKKIFKDPKLAAIHADLEYVIDQIGTFDISLNNILYYVYMSNPAIGEFIASNVSDTQNFFKDQYESYIVNSKHAADILVYIKLGLQQAGSIMEPTSV